MIRPERHPVWKSNFPPDAFFQKAGESVCSLDAFLPKLDWRGIPADAFLRRSAGTFFSRMFCSEMTVETIFRMAK
jgi:hypothetical protein